MPEAGDDWGAQEWQHVSPNREQFAGRSKCRQNAVPRACHGFTLSDLFHPETFVSRTRVAS